MKEGFLALMMVAGAMSVAAGPSSPNDFTASAIRQDLTGQGTYHRQGLLREQSRALAGQVQAATAADGRQKSWIGKIWNSIFPSKSARSTQP